jgi:DNA-binding response OmpR family regulator
VQENDYDLLILDINVPGIDGLTLLEKLQSQKIQIPTIYISALVDIEDISRAFNLGCHDYLKKPFHLKELTLRINKILQTRYVPQEHFRLSKSYSFDAKSAILYFENEAQVLTHRQVQIVQLLAKNRSRVVHYDLFRSDVWDDFDIDVATIRAEINRLKKSLKEDFITNIRSIGYMIKRPL